MIHMPTLPAPARRLRLQSDDVRLVASASHTGPSAWVFGSAPARVQPVAAAALPLAALGRVVDVDPGGAVSGV